MSNGVRNLRAMFENSNAASSPEPRGRSPVDSSAPPDSSDRPKSKVRASFVPVEPPAAHNSTDLGQTKGTPTNSVNAHRRESFSVSEDKVEELAELKKVVSDEREERRKSVAIPEAVPEQAVASRESSVPAPLSREEIEANDMPNLGSIMKGSDFPQPAASDDPVPVPELEKVDVAHTPAQPEETAVEKAEVSPMPSPEPTPAQPAENPDKATTGAQEDLVLRPAAPTDEAAVEDDMPAQEEAAAQKEIPAAEEAAIEEAAVEEEAAVAEAAIADEQVAAAEEAAIVEEEAPSALPVDDAQPAENPDKPVTGAQEEVALRPAAPTDAPAVIEEVTLAPEETPAAEASKPADSKAKANGAAAEKKSEIKKPATISTAKPKTPSTAAKSPLPKPAPKTPPKPKAATPAAKPSPTKASKQAAQPKPTAPKEPVKAPATKAPAAKAPVAKAPVAKTSRSSLRPAAASSSATAPTAGAASKAKLSAPSAESKKPAAPAPRKSTSPSGFKKPAPKSPTRPVGLPSRLTAPTAASAAKHGEEPKVEQKVTRKPSTTTRAAPKPAAPRASRPSVAPSAPKRPESRTSTVGSAPKGGFLERMMRPTAASSSKTHEKPHEKATSPPRKPAASKPSTLQKGKKKVEDVAAKAKAAVTNGHGDEEHKDEEHKDEERKEEEPKVEEEEAPKESEPAEQATEEAPADEASHEPAKAATPVQDVDFSTAELQTPNFQGETVR